MTVKSLLEMSEAAGMKQLDVLVSRAHREGWDQDLVQTLTNIAANSTAGREERQKASTFLSYANELRRSLRP
jgi:hypothetical protein